MSILLVNTWFGASVACHACSFIFMYIYQTSFGSRRSVDYENCRFVRKSKKGGLAMVKVWIMRMVFCLFVACLCSIQRLIIKHVLACARNE